MMKRFLTTVVVTLLISTMLADCGGNQDTTGQGKASENSTEHSSENESEKNETVKIEYNEIELGYVVVNEKDKDTSLVDGSEIKLELENSQEYDIILNGSVDLYDVNKAKVGYTKEGVVCCYAQLTQEWCIIGNNDYSELYYAKADELLPFVEVYENVAKDYMDMGIWTRDLTVKIPDGAEKVIKDNELRQGYIDYVHVTESITVYNQYGMPWGNLHTDVKFKLYMYSNEWASILQEDGSPIYVKSSELQAAMADEYEDMYLLNPEGIGMEEMYAYVKAALDKAGLIYDESAFSNVDISTFSNDYKPDGYGFLSCSFPVERREETEPAFIEFIKMHSGRQYIIKSVEIREGTPNEGPGMFYIFNLYLKF